MGKKGFRDDNPASTNDCIILDEGPQRSYMTADALWNHRVGKASICDGMLALTISLGFAAIMLKKNAAKLTLDLHEDELELYEAVEYYKQGKFYLGPLGPLGVQLYSLGPLCKNFMRKMSLVFSSATLGTFYLGAKRAGISPVFALVTVCGVAYLPLFQLQSLQVCLGPLQWFILSIVFYSWESFTYFPQLSTKWFAHLVLLAISIGLSVSTKYLGFATWAWIFILVALHFWNTISDVQLSTCFVVKSTTLQASILTLIPGLIFLLANTLQLLHWSEDVPEFSRFMSSNFKAYLRGPIEHPAGLNYGSTVTLRHLESLGGYLHSHNYTYETGSFGQQVTLTQIEGDPDNEWIVENKFPDKNNVMINKKIHDSDQIRFRHRRTGKLLRASTAKPPVSQEEYDLEVSGTGDFDYAGDSDELWTIRVVNAPRRSPVKPLESIVNLQNEGHSCALLAHDIRLPEWGFNQQEVLCVEEPMESRTRFKFELVRPAVKEEEYATFYCKKGKISCIMQLLYELWKRQIKYNSYEKNYKAISSYNPENWPFNLIGEKLADNIWVCGSLMPMFFVMYQLLQLLKWNPYEKKRKVPLNSTLLYKVGSECALGWLFHFYPFFKNPHSHLDVTLYLPALLLGQMLSAEIFDSLYKWNRWSLACIAAYLAVVVYY
ncbi:PMT7 (YDR307W) [Zygosaccharomyces parabailii]|nr:PMT7 (YDR307W) [Zygosaccharomyces parabailii]